MQLQHGINLDKHMSEMFKFEKVCFRSNLMWNYSKFIDTETEEMNLKFVQNSTARN